MTENFSQAIMSDTKPQIKETQRTLSKINTRGKNDTLCVYYSNCEKSKLKKKFLNEVRREKIKTLLKRVGKIRIT